MSRCVSFVRCHEGLKATPTPLRLQTTPLSRNALDSWANFLSFARDKAVSRPNTRGGAKINHCDSMIRLSTVVDHVARQTQRSLLPPSHMQAEPRVHDYAGQPDPEVLYFCTTCGGILRAGEDGRWRRRRRPSSAPASSRRRRTVFDPASSKHQNLDGKGRARDDGEGDAEDFEDGERRGGVSVADDMRGTAEKLTKLRYACCARRIQNAYRDFRHRRYLIDWALSVVSVFGADTMKAHVEASRLKYMLLPSGFCPSKCASR